MTLRRHTFELAVEAFISGRKLLHRQAPVLVALSGGADSVALLAVLQRLGYDCRAAHCNFHLRGEESMRDMRFCQQLCSRLDTDLYIRDFDVERRMADHPSESVEMACRELRYQWFADLLDRDGAQAVAVGHHREDRAETFVLNLMRGTGIAGLTSMNARSGDVVRPLLEMSRADIESYIADCGLSYITDSSNAATDYRRNAVRNLILPLMDDHFGSATDAILRTVANLEGIRSVFTDAIEARRKRYMKAGKIDLAELLENESSPQTVLFEFLRPLRFSYTQVCDMLDGSTMSGASFRSTDGRVLAEISRGVLELSDASRRNAIAGECYSTNLLHDITEPVHIAVSAHPAADFVIEGLGPTVAYIDAEALEGSPVWELRHYRRGDRMVPFGATKSKLVSDIFANHHLSASDKRQTWLLTRNDEIVWIPGIRNSALYALGPGTKRYIRLQLL